MVCSSLRRPAPYKDWAQLNSRRKAKGATARLVPPSSAAAGHPLRHDAQDACRRARADAASAGRSPGATDLALRRATTRGGRRRRSQSCRRGHIAASGADVGERRMPSRVNPRRFPSPYATGQALGYFSFEGEFGRRSADVRFAATAVIGCVSSETARSRMTQVGSGVCIAARPPMHLVSTTD